MAGASCPNARSKFFPMKTRQPATTNANTQTEPSRERAVAAARRKLERLLEQKPCYAPFSIQSVTALANPRKPSTQRPTSDVISQLRECAQELLNRAFAGDSDAMKQFCWFAHNLIRQLTHLSQKKRREISEFASTYDDWPILYAPDDDPRAIYDNLHVGTDSFVERYAGRKINRENHWTKLALLVLGLMRWCKERLPEITQNQPCQKVSPCSLSVGETDIRIYYYDTPNGIFEVPEWCEWCRELPDKLRPENVNQFWKPGRLAVLQYWYENQRADGSAYADALKSAYPGKHGLDSERRNNALDAIKRAMGSLAGANKT